MSAIFRSKLFEGKSGYFADSVGIGVKLPSESLHISGGNLKVEEGFAYFNSGIEVNGSADGNYNLFVNTSGVGVNNQNPTCELDVSGKIKCSEIDMNNGKVINLQWPQVGGDPVTLAFLLQLSGHFQAQIDSLK